MAGEGRDLGPWIARGSGSRRRTPDSALSLSLALLRETRWGSVRHEHGVASLESPTFSRRGGGAAGLLILNDARSARSYQANEKLRVAAVGIGGMGAWNLAHFAGENVEFLGRAMLIKPSAQPVMTGEDIVALCDVDERPTDRLIPGKRNPAGRPSPATRGPSGTATTA